MSAPNIHVFHDRVGWALFVEGKREPISHYPGQRQAVAAATAKAKREHAELLIHRRGERIGSWDSYAHDLPQTD
ncbi:DUF2188 domain-containing protein [Cupriavidus sp. UYPR2.512]|uniref:DUF2188 domain-containing protein n=1 Tax=Cupriavidus sp. UYPR2.512 TaxID=1080187 RepID=UPI0009DA1A56|nr:DUF2188 domain-containing protein [Cupriavidus sp. UYPR2.512]